MYYKQTTLRRDSCVEVSWIPETLAHVGKRVRLKTQGGAWEDGWVVDSVGIRVNEDVVLLREREHLKHRTQTDLVRDPNGRWTPVR